MILSNIFWKFSERILAQFVSFVVALILARLLMPEQFGIVSLVIVFIEIANTLVVSGFSTSLIQKKDADELDFSSVFYFSFLLSIVVYILIYFGVDPLSKFFNNELIVPVFRVMGIRIIISSINMVQHAYVARNLIFKKYFFSTLFGTVISAIVGIYLAIKGFGVWALVYQYLTNTIVDTIVLLFTVEWKPKLVFSFFRIKKLFSFGWKITLDSLFSTLLYNMRNFFIGKFYSPAELAYYTKSQSIPSLFLNNINTSVSSVLLPAMSNVNYDNDLIVNYLRRANMISSYILFPIFTGIILISSEFVNIVLTPKWSPMIPYIRIYCLICITMVFMPSRNEALKSIGRSDVLLIENTIVRVIDICFIILFIRKSPYVLILSQLVTYVICLFLVIFNAYKYNNYDVKLQLIDIKNSVIGCLGMVLVLSLISSLNISMKYSLTLKILIGIITYILISHVLDFKEFKIIIEIIKKYLINCRSFLKRKIDE